MRSKVTGHCRLGWHQIQEANMDYNLVQQFVASNKQSCSNHLVLASSSSRAGDLVAIFFFYSGNTWNQQCLTERTLECTDSITSIIYSRDSFVMSCCCAFSINNIKLYMPDKLTPTSRFEVTVVVELTVELKRINYFL